MKQLYLSLENRLIETKILLPYGNSRNINRITAALATKSSSYRQLPYDLNHKSLLRYIHIATD